MIKCLCLVSDGSYQYEYAYSLAEFKQLKLTATKKGKSKYINLPITFDIETTTYQDNKDICKEGIKAPYQAFMYHWQFCIENHVVFGRNYKELLDLLEYLKNTYDLGVNKKLVIYVHNLSFEFQYLYDIIPFTNVFATDTRKVLKAESDCFEFRCSYRLSNMSLAKMIENTPNTIHYKAKNDLDYRIYRSPTTKLTELENGYCYNDVKGLYEAILEYLKKDNLDRIPLTSTGFVRRDIRLAMRKNKENRKLFTKTLLTLEQYDLIKEAFRGGDTGTNRYRTNTIVRNVSSYDISSSYPFIIATSNQYPIGKFMYHRITSISEHDYYTKRYATVARYKFTNIKLKQHVVNPYIPISKCLIASNNVTYNGRVLKADELIITLTDVDIEIVRNQYDSENWGCTDFNFATRGMLPIELRNELLKYFYDKSLLKGIKDKEYEYLIAKQRLNAFYGMMVTDMIHLPIEFKDGEYYKLIMNEDERRESLNDYYKSYNSFLPYQWGVWTTALARKRLQEAIEKIGIDVVYWDTDSVKYVGNHDKVFNDINNELIHDLNTRNIPFSVTSGNKIYQLGIWDYEGIYEQFKTLGAKKYAYVKDGEIGLTVAGLSKSKGAKELDQLGGLEFFRNGQVFLDSGRTTAYYNNRCYKPRVINNELIDTASNIAIVDTTYTLGITDTMLEILDLSSKEIELFINDMDYE